MYTFNKQVKQEHRIIEKCCLGNGQLTCMAGSFEQSGMEPFSQAAMDGVNSSAVRPPSLAALTLGVTSKDEKQVLIREPGLRSPKVPIKPNLSIELPANGRCQRSQQPASDSAAVKASVTFSNGIGMKQQWSSATDRTGEPMDQVMSSEVQAPVQQTPCPGIGQSNLRANRFTPTPWSALQGQ